MPVNLTKEVYDLQNKHASKGVLIDTNLLLLLFAGAHIPSLIGHPKLRVNQYTDKDFLILREILRPFHKIIVTPQILAEISNLSKLEDKLLATYYSGVSTFLREAQEEHVSKDILLGSTLLPRMGFTDVSILEYAKTNNSLVLTDDFPLFRHIIESNCDCIYFTYLRELV